MSENEISPSSSAPEVDRADAELLDLTLALQQHLAEPHEADRMALLAQAIATTQAVLSADGARSTSSSASNEASDLGYGELRDRVSEMRGMLHALVKGLGAPDPAAEQPTSLMAYVRQVSEGQQILRNDVAGAFIDLQDHLQRLQEQTSQSEGSDATSPARSWIEAALREHQEALGRRFDGLETQLVRPALPAASPSAVPTAPRRLPLIGVVWLACLTSCGATIACWALLTGWTS